MIPRTFLSTYAVNGQQQMVVAFLDNITGLTRWVDYIPVKLAQGGRENSYDNNGFIDVAVVAKSLTSVPFKDYVPVYADTAATDAWQVNFTGYIPYGYAGSGDASLMLDFTSNFQAFDSRITFTRASNATYFNSAGLLTNTSFNALTYSNNLENAAWTKTAATVTANVTTGPFGVVDAESLTEDTATSDHKISQTTASSVATQQVFSIYAKADTRSVLALLMNNGASGSAQFLNFDLAAGTATGSANTSVGWTGATASIVSVGNGWYRCILTANSAGTAGITATASIVVGGSTNYTGDGTSGLFLYGAQLQTGVISAYIPTTTVANSLPRLDYNPATLAAQGLLIEEQRTNLLTYSSDFDNAGWTKSNTTVAANVVTSPTGNFDADKLVENTGAGAKQIYQMGVSFTSGTVYTYSFFAKAGERGFVYIATGPVFNASPVTSVNLTTGAVVLAPTGNSSSVQVTNVGNGWFRIAFTATASSTAINPGFDPRISVTGNDTGSYTGDGTSGIYLYGAQLEAGAFATSYIPTAGSQATRAADVASVNTLSPWYNASEGTLYVQAQDMSDAAHATSQPRAVSINNGSNSSIDISRVPASAQGRARVDDAGVSQFNALTTAWPLATQAKVALAYKANDFAACLGGGAVATDALGSIPTVTTLTIGNFITAGVNGWAGWIQRVSYYPRRLSDAELQSLTT